ncbi:MAG TPA: CsiV family protein [Steroidobacteraceae bacterium]
MHHATKFLRLSLAALLLFASGAGAQQSTLQSYDVELIIFRVLSSNATPEDWTLEAARAGEHLATRDEDAPESERTIATSPTTPTMSFPGVPESRYKLTSIVESLRRSRNYQPLAHFAWTQPGYPRGNAPYMAIEPWVPPGSGLGGQVSLARGRYLHLTLELTYDLPETGERYVLRQTRRMRSNERHYLDHPKFGVIAIVTPTPTGP